MSTTVRSGNLVENVKESLEDAETQDILEEEGERTVHRATNFCEDFVVDFVDTYSYSQENPDDALRCILRNSYSIPCIFAICEILDRVAYLISVYEEKGKLPKTKTFLDAQLKKMTSSLVSKVDQVNSRQEFRDELTLSELAKVLGSAVQKNRAFFFGDYKSR